MSKTTFKSYVRQRGSASATPSVGFQVMQFSFDPTQASATTSKTLPKGATPLFAQNINGGATGGTSPTVNIGTSGDPDGFATGLDADGATGLITGGALLGTELTTDTEIYAGVGGSAATGGSVTAAVYFIMADAGEL